MKRAQVNNLNHTMSEVVGGTNIQGKQAHVLQ